MKAPAQWVVQGILSAPRKNLQVIAQSLGKSDHQALNHFLSDFVWDWTTVSDQVALRFYKPIERLNAMAKLCLIIDERAFRDAKQELGMDQYQVRGYAAWHKHMALVMMAQQFIQQEKVIIDSKQITVPTQDVVRIITLLILPQKNFHSAIQQIIIKNKTLFAKIRYLTK